MWYTKIVGHWQKVKCEYFEWNVDCSTAGETVWKTNPNCAVEGNKLSCFPLEAPDGSQSADTSGRRVAEAAAGLMGQNGELAHDNVAAFDSFHF